MNEVKKDTGKKVFDKGFFIGLGVTAGIIAVVSVCVFLYEFYALYHGVYPSDIALYNSMADVFMIPAVLCLLFYAIVFVSREGAFDAIVYSAKLAFYSVFARNIRKTKLPATYGDYRAMKLSKDRSSTLFMLFADIPFVIVGIIFVILAAIAQ